MGLSLFGGGGSDVRRVISTTKNLFGQVTEIVFDDGSRRVSTYDPPPNPTRPGRLSQVEEFDPTGASIRVEQILYNSAGTLAGFGP